MFGRNTIDENGQSALPGVQVITRDASSTQSFDQELSEVIESLARDAAFLVAVSHVVNVAQKLELIIHGRDDDIETIGDEGDLLVVLRIRGQSTVSNLDELGEVLLETGSASEESGN